MEYTKIDGFAGGVILTAGMVMSAGDRLVGVFDCEADAESSDADRLALGTTAMSELSPAQREIAERNSAQLQSRNS